MKGWRVAAGGLVLGATFVAFRQWSPPDGSPLFFWMLGGVTLVYLLTLRELVVGRTPSRAVLLLALLLALLWRWPLAVAPVGRDADVYRYLWDARLQRAGMSPYAALPSDPALDWVHSPATRRMNNPDVPSPYPPVAQWYFRGVTAVRESPEALKVSLVACEVLLVAVLWRWLVFRGRDPAWVLAYAWHPLATLEIARNGHFDVVGALLVCLSAFALMRKRQTAAAIWFALAVGIKLLPIVLAPLYWRRVRVRDGVAGGAVLLLAAAPFLWDGIPHPGSIPNVVERFRFNAPLFSFAQAWVGAWGAAWLALIVGVGASVTWWRRGEVSTPAAWAWPLGAALAFAPLIYPWYLLWLIPFATAYGTLPLFTWSLSVLPTYAVWHWAAAGGAWRVPPGLLLLEWLPPVIVAAWMWKRRGMTDD